MHTLRDGGLFKAAGEGHSLAQVLQRAGIAPTYGHLVQRWLDRLVAQGDLIRDGERFVARAPLAEPDLAALWREAEALFADNQPLLAYVRHCGGLVSPVLRGGESPLETLFPGGGFELAEGLYERSATMRYINALAASGLEALGASVAPIEPTLARELAPAPAAAETTALGAAYAAGLATGFWADPDDLRANWQESRRWSPSWSEEQRAAGYAGWRKAVQRTLDWVEV